MKRREERELISAHYAGLLSNNNGDAAESAREKERALAQTTCEMLVSGIQLHTDFHKGET